MVMASPLWTPSPAAAQASAMRAFMGYAGERAGRSFGSYAELHRWSVDDRAAFWSAVWDDNGEPSNSSSLARDASAETSQFHIIQPQVVK